MGVLFLGLLIFFPLALLESGKSVDSAPVGGNNGTVSTPPRGWNSYDSFGWVVSEEEFLANAEIVSRRLLKHGYEYVVVDYLWYRRLVDGASRDSYGYDVLDPWGRVMPDPQRWPSSRGGKGFTKVAKKVHDMGLKFGIHLMRGISTQAVNANTPILDVTKGGVYEENGRQWRAKDIGLTEKTCTWMKNGFMSVNTDSRAGRAFLRSLYTQYAEWGVDFEIMTVSELLEEFDHSILFSLSPGTNVNVDMAEHINGHVNMYRITGDDWDSWPDVEAHFNIARDFAASHLIGAMGRSWPDLDMLPLGWLTNSYGNEGPYRNCNLTLDEQRTQMTLWSMARSPLIFGGDLRNIDEITFRLITNPIVLEINSFSTNNMEIPNILSSRHHQSRDTLEGSVRGLAKLKSSDYVVGHSSCTYPMAKGWFVQQQDQVSDQICWNHNSKGNDALPFCLYKRSVNILDRDVFEQQYQGKIHLLASQNTDDCLDASSKRKSTASDLRKNSFSPCKWESNQMWELNDNGTLVSDYSHLCATVEVEAEKDYANEGSEARAWIATGRKGEVYLAIFNLNSDSQVLSIRIQDLAKALPGSLSKSSCICREIWTRRYFGVVWNTLSVSVPGHGCALFVLNCK